MPGTLTEGCSGACGWTLQPRGMTRYCKSNRRITPVDYTNTFAPTITCTLQSPLFVCLFGVPCLRCLVCRLLQPFCSQTKNSPATPQKPHSGKISLTQTNTRLLVPHRQNTPPVEPPPSVPSPVPHTQQIDCSPPTAIVTRLPELVFLWGMGLDHK